MERELKLGILSPDAWEEILHHPHLQINPDTPHPMHAIYYDNPEGSLRAAGIAWRVRLEGEQWVAAIKQSGSVEGGLHQRPEWNVPVDGPEPDFSVFAHTEIWPKIEHFAGIAPQPLLETEFLRWEKSLRLEDSCTTVLVSLDKGSIRAGGRTEPILEVELELQEGSLAALLHLGSELCAVLPLCPESGSKFARGLRLSGLCTESSSSFPESGPGFRLRPRQEAGSALVDLLVAKAQEVLLSLAGVPEHPDRETFHELRKEVRSLRALLRLTRELDPNGHLQLARRELADWFHSQGERRERGALAQYWSVLALETGVSPEPLLAALESADQVKQDLHGDFRARLAAGLLRLWASLLEHPLEDGSRSLRDYVEERLTDIDHGLVPAVPAEEMAFHRLRISLKNWRYVLLALSELWPRKDAKALLKCLSALQESSGVIRDAQRASYHLEPFAGGNDGRLAYQAGMLAGFLEARRRRESRKFPRHWERLQNTPRPWE